MRYKLSVQRLKHNIKYLQTSPYAFISIDMFKKFSFFFIIISFSFAFSSSAAFSYSVSKNDISIFKKSISYVNKKKFKKAISTASKAEDPLVTDAIKWLLYQRPYAENNYADIANFINKNADWPRLRSLRNVAEKSLKPTTEPSNIINFFANKPPITGHAMFLLAKAKLAQNIDTESAPSLLKKAWVQGDFSYSNEQEFINKYGQYLAKNDHIKRVDRLLWEGKISTAKRLFKHIDRAHIRVFSARIRLMTNRKGIDSAIRKVPKNLRNDPGFLYERIKWHDRRKNRKRVYEYIKKVTTTMPYQEKWWKIKKFLVRDFIDKKQYKRAYDLASSHGNLSNKDYAEAEWLAGWLSLRFLDNPQKSYKHFYNMYHKVSFPVSRARGAYWAGRAAEANQNTDISNGWYKLSAKHPTTFYGQLASLKISSGKKIKLPAMPVASRLEKFKYRKNELLGAAYLFALIDRSKTAEKFVTHAIKQAKTDDALTIVSAFGRSIGREDLSVIASKHALRKGVILSDYGWPNVDYVAGTRLEMPLILSIIRQESRFNPKARSSANAMGMMQIIPSTAKLSARAAKVRYRKSKLMSDPEYNIRLGSTYLSGLVERLDGSYILAVASYNAGPTNAKRWIKKYGDPRKFSDSNKVIDWIESVPFAETRNYIQRVMENLQVYRLKEGHVSFALNNDIMRANSRLSSN